MVLPLTGVILDIWWST